jgi:putative oxidoreductase
MKKIILLSFIPSDKNVALLALRIILGCLLFANHGYEKLFHFNDMQQRFPDPLKLGQTFSLVLALMADSICSILVLSGSFTRIASGYIVINLLVISIFVWKFSFATMHAEIALLYLGGYLTIMIAGPGKYSLGNCLFKTNG